MRPEVLLVLQTILLYNLGSCQHAGETCQIDEDCDSWLACVNNVCTACRKVDTTCEPTGSGFLSECCPGTTCEIIPGLYGTSRCEPNKNKCLTDIDCSGGLKCLFRLGKCGMCHPNGETCTLPYDSLECCSSYCRIGSQGRGKCADPRMWPPPLPITQAPVELDTRLRPLIFCAGNDNVVCGSHECKDGFCQKCKKYHAFCDTAEDCCKVGTNKIVCKYIPYRTINNVAYANTRKICSIDLGIDYD
jgi:hypothetical protein